MIYASDLITFPLRVFLLDAGISFVKKIIRDYKLLDVKDVA